MNVPNALSLTRVPLAILIMLLAVKHAWTAAFVVLLFAAMTDVLDGYVAKRFDMATTSGELFDMIGDMAMTAGALLGLLFASKVSWTIVIVMTIVLVVVQLINSLLTGTVLFTHFGKWFMPMYFLAVIWALMLRYADLALSPAGFWVFGITLVVATAALTRLKRHRFAEWFNGKPLHA